MKRVAIILILAVFVWAIYDFTMVKPSIQMTTFLKEHGDVVQIIRFKEGAKNYEDGKFIAPSKEILVRGRFPDGVDIEIQQDTKNIPLMNEMWQIAVDGDKFYFKEKKRIMEYQHVPIV